MSSGGSAIGNVHVHVVVNTEWLDSASTSWKILQQGEIDDSGWPRVGRLPRVRHQALTSTKPDCLFTLFPPQFVLTLVSSSSDTDVDWSFLCCRLSGTDEPTRLRSRVAELEHTVRVLMDRAKERDGAYPSVDKKPGRPNDGSSTTGSSPGGSPSGVPVPGNLPNVPCGCASSSLGREALMSLVQALNTAITRLKTLPEHQRNALQCALYAQIVNLHVLIRQQLGGTQATQQPSFATTYPMGQAPISHASMGQSYTLTSPQTHSSHSHSHSSASPPQSTYDYDYLTHQPQSNAYDLNSSPLEPFPYIGSHSSTMGMAVPSSHPQAYSNAPMGGLSTSPGGSYQQYQPQSTPQSQTQLGSLHPSARSQTMPMSGYTSLSTWNSTGQGSASSQPTSRPKPSRSGSGVSGSPGSTGRYK